MSKTKFSLAEENDLLFSALVKMLETFRYTDEDGKQHEAVEFAERILTKLGKDY